MRPPARRSRADRGAARAALKRPTPTRPVVGQTDTLTRCRRFPRTPRAHTRARQRPARPRHGPGRLRARLARADRPAPDRRDRGRVGHGVGRQPVRLHRAGRAEPRHRATRACGARRSSTTSTACSRSRPASGRPGATTSPTSRSSRATTGWIVIDPLTVEACARDCLRPRQRTPRRAARDGGDLHPLAHRPLRRRARRHDAGRRRRRPLPDHRSRALPPRGDRRERDRRVRDGASGAVPVRPAAAAGAARPRRLRARQGDPALAARADRTDRGHHARPVRSSSSTASGSSSSSRPRPRRRRR